MKKHILLGIVIASALGFGSCEERTMTVVNPEAEAGTLSFELYTPSGAENVYTLLEENGAEVLETFSFAKPDYGFSTAATYSMQVSMEADFDDERTLEFKLTSITESLDVNTAELNTMIRKLHPMGDYPSLDEVQEVYLRVKCVISGATNGALDPTPIVKPAFSNMVEIRVLTFEPSESALPATYYIIGIGGWDNEAGKIGEMLIPFSLVKGYDYDPVDGQGIFSYTGYFEASMGFKIIATPGSWEDQWGMNDGDLVFNDGGSGNISVPVDGYYTFTLNSVDNRMEMTPAMVEPKSFGWIELIGDFNGWSDETIRLQSHSKASNIWYGDITLDDDGSIKFRADGGWDSNWGGKSFPFAQQRSGDDIPSEKGTYRVVFNHDDGCYFFFK